MRTLIVGLSLCFFAGAAAITVAALNLPRDAGPSASSPSPSSGVDEMLRRMAAEQAAGNALVRDLRIKIGTLQEDMVRREEAALPQEEARGVLVAELQKAIEALQSEREEAERAGAIERLAAEQVSNNSTLADLRSTVAALKDDLARERDLQKAAPEITAEEDSQPTPDAIPPEVSPKRGEEIQPPDGDGGAVIAILGGGLFGSGQSVLTPDLEEAVKKCLPAIVASSDHRILIEGHTDNLPIGSSLSGHLADNGELSLMRAMAVASLLEGAGVDHNRISAAGYGGARPIASNGTPDGRAENRRVEIRLVPPGHPSTAAAEE